MSPNTHWRSGWRVTSSVSCSYSPSPAGWRGAAERCRHSRDAWFRVHGFTLNHCFFFSVVSQVRHYDERLHCMLVHLLCLHSPAHIKELNFFNFVKLQSTLPCRSGFPTTDCSDIINVIWTCWPAPLYYLFTCVAFQITWSVYIYCTYRASIPALENDNAFGAKRLIIAWNDSTPEVWKFGDTWRMSSRSRFVLTMERSLSYASVPAAIKPNER